MSSSCPARGSAYIGVIVALGAVLLAGLPRPAAAQDSTFAKLKCADAHGGAIRGVLADSVSGAPLPERTVFLSFDCAARTDSLGRFAIAHIPPGEYRLQVGAMGFRPLRPVPVTIAADAVVELRLLLQPENSMLDCREDAGCAATLRADAVPATSLTDAQGLRYAVWRTAFALSGWRAHPASDWVPCLEEPDSTINHILARRFGRLARPADCVLDSAARLPSRMRILYLPTGQPARDIHIGGLRTSGDEAEAQIHYQGGALWGVTWECRFRREGSSWEPELCRIVGVS